MKILGNHFSKILIHLLFWALFVFISLFVFSDFYWKENPFVQYFFILLVIVYTNHQFLLPFFIKKRWYVIYALTITIIAVLATEVYCNYFALCGCSILKCLSDYLWQTLVPIIFFSFVWLLFRYIEKHDEMEYIKKENTEMELQYLKSQINPHVLFNNLNTVYAYSLEKPKETPEMILMLSNNLKHVLYGSNATMVSLQKEIEYIDNYIAFQKIRTAKIKEIAYIKEIDSYGYKIAPLLLITLIENAFKHSAANSKVTIRISVAKGVLECLCTNVINTIKIESEANPIGLKNIRKRLHLIYKGKHRLEVVKNDNYIAKLKIELL
tara:strand:+ start:4259 stop:5230 length:972 start_codon:yes stop_codon:yes gene_type:complete